MSTNKASSKASVGKGKKASPSTKNVPKDVSKDVADTPQDVVSSTPATSSEDVAYALPVLLLDDATHYSLRQEEILAIAEALQSQGHRVYVLCPAYSLLGQKASEKNISVLSSSLSFWGRLGLLWRFKRKKPVLIYAFSFATAAFARAWASMREPDATLCIQDVKELPHESKTALSAQIAAWQSFQKCIFPCAIMGKLWMDSGFESGRVHCIASALEPALWDHMAPVVSPHPSKRMVFLVHTALHEESGLPTVLKAMAQLLEWEREKNMSPSFEVRVIGSGQNFESLLTQARGLGVEQRLALLGEQPVTDVLPLVHGLILPQCNAQEVCACLTCKDGGPSSPLYTLMAAWALALPVMCTEVAPYTEWHQGKMLTFAPDDANALAENMWQCVQSANFWQKNSDNSAKMRHLVVMSRFQTDHISLHKDILEQRGWGFLCKK